MSVTYHEVGQAALYGRERTSATGSFSSVLGRPHSGGWHGHEWDRKLRELHDSGYEIVQTVYSYRTPVAIKVKGATGSQKWLKWDVYYSVTTNGKHLPSLWLPGAEYIPWDASVEDMQRIVDGKMYYICRRGSGEHRFGRFRAGHNN